MNRLLLQPTNPDFQPEWALDTVKTAFFKCTRWQAEETTDPINCPYHYFCDSIYPGNYPPIIDLSVLSLTTTCFLITIGLASLEITGYIVGGVSYNPPRKRFWLPSGPLCLPLILLALAKGQRINTLFPLSSLAPALQQLVQVSALAFESPEIKSVKSLFLDVSSVSGILHAGIYVDSVVLPYYTGFEALVFSTLSGECGSCVCRKKVLVAGGISGSYYRGWSTTMLCVVMVLFWRLACKLFEKRDKVSLRIKLALEGLSWFSSLADSVTLLVISMRGGNLVEKVIFGGLCGLNFLLILKRTCNLLAAMNEVLLVKKTMDSSLKPPVIFYLNA
ncbi:hypothetical protein AMTRI_Chr09g37420 [Amborella trichopoda]|uniref:Uncharacterized protein n=1 Tax=Amborella trichopoda TaxID=13333 RepID=W1PLW4_AMBTC|nr:uncharacterized protein LOC18436387 [Amborella trichopoda]ERN08145.1 hypothetical protein AMTR_s00018p00116130 [Amborella trichopoda]|eukprot:XP_006846470.1 uncharacterized protein LOC18436387 [Amborella trichopoda]